MIFSPVHTSRFEKDIKRYKKSGINMDEFKKTYLHILKRESLESKYKDHKLKGRYKGRRECHIKPDWLIIYKVDKKNKEIIFERTGSHAELFDKKM